MPLDKGKNLFRVERCQPDFATFEKLACQIGESTERPAYGEPLQPEGETNGWSCPLTA